MPDPLLHPLHLLSPLDDVSAQRSGFLRHPVQHLLWEPPHSLGHVTRSRQTCSLTDLVRHQNPLRFLILGAELVWVHERCLLHVLCENLLATRGVTSCHMTGLSAARSGPHLVLALLRLLPLLELPLQLVLLRLQRQVLHLQVLQLCRLQDVI